VKKAQVARRRVLAPIAASWPSGRKSWCVPAVGGYNFEDAILVSGKAGQGRLLTLRFTSRSTKSEAPRHQAGSRGSNSRHSQISESSCANLGRKSGVDSIGGRCEARRHPGRQVTPKGETTLTSGRKVAARRSSAKRPRRSRLRLFYCPPGYRGHHRSTSSLHPGRAEKRRGGTRPSKPRKYQAGKEPGGRNPHP